MAKRYISYGEVSYFCIAYIIFVLLAILSIEGVRFLKENYIFLILLIPVFIFAVYSFCQKIYAKRYLPADCVFNPLGFIELHIGNKNKDSKFKFYRICSQAILKGKYLNKPILIDTWIVDETEMERIFKQSLELKKVPFFQRMANLENKFRFDRKNMFKAKSYRYIVYPNKLAHEQNEKLKKMARI